jgi:hypothetical protein
MVPDGYCAIAWLRYGKAKAEQGDTTMGMPEVGTHNDVEVTERVLAEKQSGALELALRCKVGECEIIGYQYLVAKDGTPQERTIKNLREATGWDGQLESLLDGEWPMVQIVVEDEEYEGKKRRRVRWINPNNAEGGNGSLKGDDIKMLAAKYGAKFRALSGGVPAKPAAKPAAKPTAKPTPKPAGSTMEECWELIQKAYPGAEQDALEKEWFDTLKKALPGKHQAGFGPAEWQKVKEAIIADGQA